MENETKLLTCPFCGGEAEVWEDNVFGTFVPQCPSCNTTHGRFINRKIAVKAWNEQNNLNLQGAE